MASIYDWPDENELSPAQANAEAERRGMTKPKPPQRPAGERLAELMRTIGLADIPKAGDAANVARLSPLARRIAIGAPVLVGVGTVLDQLNREGTPVQNLVGAGTGLVGNAGGAAFGGFLGGFGGPLAPITVPLGAAAGSMIGGEMLSSLGRTLAGATAMTPEERARQQLIKDAEANARAKAAQLEILAPTQQMLAQKALESEVKRAAALSQLAFQEKRWDAMARGLNEQTAASNAANQTALSGIYANGII